MKKILKQNFFVGEKFNLGINWNNYFFRRLVGVAKTDEILVAQGKLEPIGKVKDIQIPVGGVVKKILIDSGDLVEKGEVLIELDAEISKQNLISISDQLDQKKSIGIKR